MLKGNLILAVVPARSGSKGIPDKNMKQLAGTTLIGHAGKVLSALPWLDYAVISTDKLEYAQEAERHGLAAPFLRPAELSTDKSGAVETMNHAIKAVEQHYKNRVDVALIVEPTSPLRRPADIERAVQLLLERKADSVISVSKLDSKTHPGKALTDQEGKLGFYEQRGASVVARQSLETLYYRNGVIYALTRACLIEKLTIFSDNSLPFYIDRPLVNIDVPIDLEWAEFLLTKGYANE